MTATIKLRECPACGNSHLSTKIYCLPCIGGMMKRYAAGDNAKAIGEAFGISKNAVIGLAKREGVSHPGAGPAHEAAAKARRANAKGRAKKPKKFVPKFIGGPLPVKGLCKYPTGHPGEEGFGYCGHKQLDGSPYCPEHHAICHDQRPRKKADKTDYRNNYVPKSDGGMIA